MEFRTTLLKYNHHNFIDYSSNVMLIGSCFVEHLNSYFQKRKYQSFINPCGISFNPISIAQSMYLASGQTEFDEKEIIEQNGRFFHFDFHSSFSAVSKEACINNIRSHLSTFSSSKTPDILILSLGTAFAYKLKSSHEIVNNCHKLAQQNFDKVFLSAGEIIRSLSNAVSSYIVLNPEIKIIVTVSPVRHIKDGLIENNRSKASLILACHELENEFHNVIYFPSYELLMDDLRDYRFYARDLIHPSEEAIDYIMDFFEKHFMNVHEDDLRNRIININKRLTHKAFLPESVQHQEFLKTLMADIKNIVDLTGFNFSDEIDEINRKLLI